MQNFNRNYVDLAALAGDALEAELTDDAAANLKIVRRAFARAIADAEAKTDLAQQRLTLLGWAHDADYALDLHCDHRAVMHFYAAPARPEHTDLLGRCLGADLALMSEVSGGNAFDEALSASWAALKRRFAGRFPIPDGCYSATVEYRGQFDVSDDMARTDAANLMDFLVAVGAVESRGEKPRHKPPHVWPLGGCAEVFAPVGGVVTWECGAGDEVQKGQVIAHVTDTARRQRHAIHAPAEGLLFRTELWPSCLRGHSLAHVAGPVALGENKILSD
jgi:predicted deacylase